MINLHSFNFYKSKVIQKEKIKEYNVILLKGDNIVYDSTSKGMPLLITLSALKNYDYNDLELPVFLDHEDKVQTLIGRVKDINFKNPYIVGKLEFFNTQLAQDIKKLVDNKIITDLSVKMLSEEHFDYIKKINIVDKIKKFLSVSIVLEGADKFAKFQF